MICKAKEVKKTQIFNRELSLELAKEMLSSLFYFDKYILGYSKMEEDVHLNVCNFIDGRYLPAGQTPKPFKLVLMPRNCFKTSMITIGESVRQIVLNPDIRILIAHEVFEVAKRYISEIRGHFERNELFRETYGDFVGKQWREDYFIVSKRKRNQKEPTVSCAGIDVVKVGQHFDLIIADDIVTQNNITTKEQMEKVIDFYKLALSLLDIGGKLIIVGTRWHFNDLYNHILEEEKHRFNFLIQSSYNPDGSLWFPNWLTENYLDNMKKSQGSYKFSCLYKNSPIDDESATFRKDNLKYYTQSGKRLIPEGTGKGYLTSECNIYLTIDPAISQTKQADFTGMVVVAVDPDSRKFVLWAKKYKFQPKELIDEIFRLWEIFSPQEIGIEVAVFQKLLKFFLFEEMKRRRKYLPIIELKSEAKSKEMRISSLQPFFEMGEIYLKREFYDLEDEILRFPVGKHDDILDALAYQTSLWVTPSISKKEETPVGSFKWFRDRIIREKKNPYIIGQKNDWRDIYYG